MENGPRVPGPSGEWSKRLRLFLAAGALLVLVAGGGFAALESDSVSNYGEGVWWALSLMTTVGFVGESPGTTAGRILSGVLMVAGFGLLTVTTAAVASLFVYEQEEPAAAMERALDAKMVSRIDEIAERIERIERALDERADR